MSRRRKKNPLLTKILVVSLIVHAIGLPIAAHFGAFKRMQQEFGTSRVVMVNVAPAEEKKVAAEKHEKKAAKAVKEIGKKAGSPRAASTARSNVPQPKVVAAGPEGEGGTGEGAPTVDPNGTGKAGELPQNGKPSGGGTADAGSGGAEVKNPEPDKQGTSATPPKTEVKNPEPPVKPPPPLEPKPEPPKVNRFVQAQATFEPQAEIPEELRTEPFEKTVVVECDVDDEGKPVNVKVASGSGVRQLDDLGLDTARRYRFRPATMNDKPVTQHIRFTIIFKVD